MFASFVLNVAAKGRHYGSAVNHSQIRAWALRQGYKVVWKLMTKTTWKHRQRYDALALVLGSMFGTGIQISS